MKRQARKANKASNENTRNGFHMHFAGNLSKFLFHIIRGIRMENYSWYIIMESSWMEMKMCFCA